MDHKSTDSATPKHRKVTFNSIKQLKASELNELAKIYGFNITVTYDRSGKLISACVRQETEIENSFSADYLIELEGIPAKLKASYAILGNKYGIDIRTHEKWKLRLMRTAVWFFESDEKSPLCTYIRWALRTCLSVLGSIPAGVDLASVISNVPNSIVKRLCRPPDDLGDAHDFLFPKNMNRWPRVTAEELGRPVLFTRLKTAIGDCVELLRLRRSQRKATVPEVQTHLDDDTQLISPRICEQKTLLVPCNSRCQLTHAIYEIATRLSRRFEVRVPELKGSLFKGQNRLRLARLLNDRGFDFHEINTFDIVEQTTESVVTIQRVIDIRPPKLHRQVQRALKRDELLLIKNLTGKRETRMRLVKYCMQTKYVISLSYLKNLSSKCTRRILRSSPIQTLNIFSDLSIDLLDSKD